MTVVEGMELVADFYGITVDDLIRQDRRQPLALQRQVAMYVCREQAGASYPELARAFERHHSTIIHGVHEIEDRLLRGSWRTTGDITMILCDSCSNHQEATT